jgi:hypothetical protein
MWLAAWRLGTATFAGGAVPLLLLQNGLGLGLVELASGSGLFAPR